MRELADFLFRYPFKVLLKWPSRFYNVKYYHGLRILSSYLTRRQIHIYLGHRIHNNVLSNFLWPVKL